MTLSSHAALQLFVDRLTARSGLTEEEASAVLALPGHAGQVRANVDIVSPGEMTDHACLVVDGIVGRFGQIVDGRRQITALHIAGDMCDLHAVATPEVSWPLQALSTTTVLRIPLRALSAVAQAWPKVGEAFWRDCSVDASVLSQWVVNIGRRDAVCRMAHLLCEMAVRMENAGLGNRTQFRLGLSQIQLGDVLGLTSVHINRTLKTLRESGVANMRSGDVQISDWHRLVQLGDFDEGYLLVDAWRGEGRQALQV